MKKVAFIVLTIIMTMFSTSAYAADNVSASNYDEFCGRYDMTATLRMSFPDEYFDNNMKIVNDILSDKRTDLVDTNNPQEFNYLYSAGIYLLPFQLQAYRYQQYKLGQPDVLLQQTIDSIKKKDTPGKDNIRDMELINDLSSGLFNALQ